MDGRCWLPLLSDTVVGGGVGFGRGGEEAGVNTSGELDCVSVVWWSGGSSPVMMRSILLRAAVMYSVRVRGLCTVMVSVSTRLCHVGTSTSVGCR